jgi:hypothetical protein
MCEIGYSTQNNNFVLRLESSYIAKIVNTKNRKNIREVMLACYMSLSVGRVSEANENTHVKDMMF